MGPEGDGADAARAHYPEADERGRLDTPFGQVEFARTAEIREGPSRPRRRPSRASVGAGPLRALARRARLRRPPFALQDLEERLDDPPDRKAVLAAARELSRVPELLGLSPHLLATARRPPFGV